MTWLTESELGQLERYFSNITRIGGRTVLRLITEVRERRKREDKYRWHDLRKNPDDLPISGSHVLCKRIFKGVEIYDCIDRCGNSETGNTWWQTAYHLSKIVAWRYIEPFEEVEE